VELADWAGKMRTGPVREKPREEAEPAPVPTTPPMGFRAKQKARKVAKAAARSEAAAKPKKR
jgi:hypothetical protein